MDVGWMRGGCGVYVGWMWGGYKMDLVWLSLNLLLQSFRFVCV